MERLDTHVCTVDTALQQRPEVFEAVGVDATIDVLDSVIDNLVGVVSRKTFIGKQGIRIQRSSCFYMLPYFSL